MMRAYLLNKYLVFRSNIARYMFLIKHVNYSIHSFILIDDNLSINFFEAVQYTIHMSSFTCI